MTVRHDRVVRGIALMFLFAAIAPVMDTLVKLGTRELPAAEIALARFGVQAMALIPVILFLGQMRRPPRRIALLHLTRGACVASATVAFMAALKHMPLADTLAIAYVMPLILTLLGAVVLKEKIGPRRIIACLVGFAGALLVVQPTFAETGPVALLPLGTALLFAVYMLLTRLMADEPPLVLQSYSGLIGALLVGLVLLLGDGTGSDVFDPVWPSPNGWALMLGVGLVATCSHLCLTLALREAPAATLAPIGYFELVSAAILGYLVFNEFPDLPRLLGICIIVASGLFVLWREREEARAAEARSVSPYSEIQKT